MEKLNLANDTNAKPKDNATTQPAKATAEKNDANNQQNDKSSYNILILLIFKFYNECFININNSFFL